MRALLINSPDHRGSPVPFIPSLVAGPPITQEASAILPADSELLLTASLDYAQMYDGLIKTLARQNNLEHRGSAQNIKGGTSESPFAAYEAKLGLKVRDDLIPLLGSEIAATIPVKMLGLGIKTASSSFSYCRRVRRHSTGASTSSQSRTGNSDLT